MSSITEEVFRDTGQSLPNNVGEAYNKVTKLGSWVTSGINGYRTAVQEWNELKKYFKRWGNLKEDPSVLFYTINSILRENPVKLPDHMSASDMNMLRSLLKRWMGNNPNQDIDRNSVQKRYTDSGRVLLPLEEPETAAHDSGSVMKSLPENSKTETHTSDSVIKSLPEDPKLGNRIKSSTTLGTYYDPYSDFNSVQASTPSEVMKLLDDAGYYLNQKYVQNFEIGSISQWYITIEPYVPNSGNRFTLVPDLPNYYIPDLSSKTPALVGYSFGNPCPVISWNLTWGTLNSESISLFNQSSMNIPMGFKYDMILNLNILDDVHLSMDKYLRRYVNEIYDIEKSQMAPYWASAFKITLTIFKPGYHINYKFKFIAVPINWAPTFEGSSNPENEHNLTIDFSIIGLEKYSSLDESQGIFDTGSNNNQLGFTWDNITLKQN